MGLNIYQKLLEIQHELKAPKGQYNNFGGYKFRSCEDILEAVKPLCYKYKAAPVLTDDVVSIDGRFYVKATARLYDTEEAPYNFAENTAYAREDDTKKGMDGAQLTGCSSSYARKYALNGLFNIDDTKDPDTDEYARQTAEDVGEKKLDKTKLKTIQDLPIDPDEGRKVLAEFGYEKSTDIKVKDYAEIFKKLKELV